jgi:hypothetical protein
MKTKHVTIAILMLLFSSFANSQQKYAVLISGVAPSWDQMQVPSGLSGTITSPHQFDEFWNDTYLMWELLTQKYGYNNENVIVLYSTGTDYMPDNTNTRYRASRYSLPKITDNPATIAKVTEVLSSLQAQLTADDFLFVWTFGHGFENGYGNGLIQLNDGLMTDNTFAGLVNPISAKKVVWMQQCFGGDFADNLTVANTYFLSAGSQGEITHPAEDICPANYKNERYYVGSTLVDTCYHGEFNFHMYSSQNGQAPNYSPYHGHPTSCPNIYYLYSNIDSNADGFIDHAESYTWLSNAEFSQETPLLNDPNNLKLYTSFQYPTLLHDNLTQANLTCRGLIGISNTATVRSGSTLTIAANSKVHLLNGGNLIVEAGANLVVESGVQFIKSFPASAN